MKTFYFKVTRISFAVPLIIFLNIIIYLKWSFADSQKLEEMSLNYLVSWNAIADGRYWVLISSVFSHNLFFHFFLNMFVLNSFGKIIEYMIGFRSFVKFYIISGVISSLSHAVASKYILNDPALPALGASGSVAAVILLFALTHPKHKVLLLGIIPMPAITAGLLFIGIDLWGLVAQAGGHGLPIGHGAHLGGAFTGIIYYFLFYKNKLDIDPYVKPQDPNVIDVEYQKIE